MNRLALVAAISILASAGTASAGTPAASIDTFVILVHPCAYEGSSGAETEPYRKLERAACQRWFAAIATLPKSSFAVQIDGGSNGPTTHTLHKALVDRLGAGRVVRIGVQYASPETPGPLREYYGRIERRIREQIAGQKLSFDPAAANAVIWGQSFEGCASGYGSAVAHALGLKTPTRFDYAMTAPDAPFLLDARYLRTIDVPTSDIIVYLFALQDGRYAAFFRSCLTPQWLDHRPIRLALDPKRFAVLAKNTGEVRWPNGKPPTAEQARSSRYNQWRTVEWPKDSQPTGPNSFTLSTVQERFVVGKDLGELTRAIQSAEVRPALGTANSTTLGNEHIRLAISPAGSIQRIDNLASGESYVVESDVFTLATDRGALSNRSARPERAVTAADGVEYAFSFPGVGRLALVYRLGPGCAYAERHLRVDNGPGRLLLERLELGRTRFAASPCETIRYDTFWYAPTACFLRWTGGGLFTGLENPFFETAAAERELALSFAPAMWIEPGAVYTSEPQFLGVYRRSGRTIVDHWPRTVAGAKEGVDRPRFRNPSGHLPLDENEIQAMRRFARDYLAPRQDRFQFILYMYWYPIAQLPDNAEAEARYCRVIDNFQALGGDLIIFNPLVRYERPGGDGADSWNVAPAGSTARRILEYARSRGLRCGFYMGVAAQGDRGNGCNLPFVPEKTQWKRLGPLGGTAGENCLACDDFAHWWHAVQRNTIARHNLGFWSWDPGPGHGAFCYSEAHGHVPGMGGYKGWRNSVELIRKLADEFPSLYLMAYYGRKEYGLWGLRGFDQHESYWEQTVFYGATLHPDLHDDRVNADGARLQSWWNENFRVLPTQMNHALVHRIGENSYDARLPQAWDYGGWRYSLMSGIASSGSVTACILPDDVRRVPGMVEFYRKWLGWARRHFQYVPYNIALSQPGRIGGVDVWARIKGDRGFIFLCNPAPRPARTELALDDRIGLPRRGRFTLTELYPQDNVAWSDARRGRDVFDAGESVTVEVPAHEVLLLELAPATAGQSQRGRRADAAVAPAGQSGQPGQPGQPGPGAGAGRMLDDWRTADGGAFSFPFHAAAKSLVLRTRFRADAAMRTALAAATPSNLKEIAPLVERWRNDRSLPHNFVWARPDRLWLALPFADASRVGGVALQCNGKATPVQCFSVSDVKIIYYADLTDAVRWDAENELTLRLSNLEANQFLGPYLDCPATAGSGSPGGRRTDAARVVFDRPVDPDMPGRGRNVGPPGRGPQVLRAEMTPPLVGGTAEIVFTAVVDLPPEQLQGAYLSVGWLGSDVRMAFDRAAGAWVHCYPTPGRFPILDGESGHVWAVGSDGRFSPTRSFPVKWNLGGFSPEGAAASLASRWPHVRADALAALAVCNDPRAAEVARRRLQSATDPDQRRRLADTIERWKSTLGDKTLVAWATPANLTQRGGGVLSIEKFADQGTPDFDAIVLGEIAPGKWMPGSGAFRRTPRDQSAWAAETAAPGTLVQLAVVYRGRQLSMYRNGRLYAQYAIEPTGFGPTSRILLGKRHLDAAGACWFAGAIEEARLGPGCRGHRRAAIGPTRPNQAAGPMDLRPRHGRRDGPPPARRTARPRPSGRRQAAPRRR